MTLFEAVQNNLLSPAVLFFFLGFLAALVKTDLKFPEPLYAALTIYLLVAIGFKGGVAVAEAGLASVWLPVVGGLAIGGLIPLWCYPVLRWGKLPGVDAASIAAHFGSVSAVTYLAASNFLKASGVAPEGYMAAQLAVMESPAIIVGILLGRRAMRRSGGGNSNTGGLAGVLHEALLGRSVYLLLGGLLVGFLSGPRGYEATAPLFVAPFHGIVALFLLEMGYVAGRRAGDLRAAGPFLVGFGIIMPVVNAAAATLLGAWIGLSTGGTAIFATLAASASYIAAPAAMRLSLPDARPALSLGTALAVTFPFNVTLGIPLYYEMAKLSALTFK
ncbi:MAG: sodium-dependent bicarbonate transport family permease [Terrimicrobiaceae bacterium]